jgi:hypothetical protein
LNLKFAARYKKNVTLLLLATCLTFFGALSANAADVQVEEIDRPDDVPARTVLVEIKNTKKGMPTELEVLEAKGKWLQPFKLVTIDDTFRFRVSPGRYKLRTRNFGKKMSVWSKITEFEVPFKPVEKVFPDNAKIEPKGEKAEKLRFEWPPTPGAEAYRVKIYQSGNMIRHVITKQPWLSTVLETDSKYKWELQPMMTADQVDDGKKSEVYKFRILKPSAELFPAEVKLAAKLHAVKYQFELIQIRDDDTTTDPSIYENHEPTFIGRLAPAEYELRVRSIFSTGEFSAWSSPRNFFVRLPKPSLVTPVDNLRIIATDEDKAEVFFRWTKVKGANRYTVVVNDEQGRQVLEEVVKGNEAWLKVPHHQKYTWTAVPQMKREKDRSPASTPDVQSFTVSEYVRLELGKAEEPSQLYSWGRSTFASTTYTAQNYDSHSFINQPVFMTSGEVALGYWHRLTNFGVLFQGSIWGMDIDGVQKITYNASTLLGYRMRFSGSKRARIWGGWSWRQTPEILVDGQLATVNIKTIMNMGPTLLGTFTNAWNDKWGYQLFGGTYYGMNAVRTPNNLPQEQYLTFFTSAYATYKWGKRAQINAGYTYQIDEAGYGSNDRTGSTNHVKYSGHYLSLLLIYGLQEPKK